MQDDHDQKLYVPFVWHVYWDRLIAKTSHLKPDEFGAYILLRLHQLRKGDVPVSEIARLAQIIGCTPAVAKRIWEEIGAFFAPDDDGRWRNRRLEEGRAEQQKKALNGSRGGRAKHDKHG